MEPCSLTKTGREVAEELTHRLWEVELTREFDRRSECEEYAAAHGLRKIGHGAKRAVYALADDLVEGASDPVLKVAYAFTGYYEIRSEGVWWEEMPDRSRDCFTPVWEYGRGWLLTARAETDVTDEDVRELEAALDEVGWIGEDLKPANVGKLEGRPVLVDYGKGDFEEP